MTGSQFVPVIFEPPCIYVMFLGLDVGYYTTDSVLEFPQPVGTSRTALRALSLAQEAQNEAEILLSSSDGVRMRGPVMFITTNAAAAAAASLIVNCFLTTTTTKVLTPLLLLIVLQY